MNTSKSFVPGIICRDAIEDKLGPFVETTIYIIRGYVGSSTYRHKQWDVASFLDEEQAKELFENIVDWCRENRPYNPGISGVIACGSIYMPSGSLLSGHYSIPSIVCGSIGSITLPVSGTIGSTPKCPFDDKYCHDGYYGTNYEMQEVTLRV